MPKVSVIIPTWNRENLIRNTIHSAQNQTIKNIEILVCDDGSTDDTNQIVKEINKKDKRVKWIEG
ncbi:glycosyltransferase, partial [Candidatus Parcubacteria bacterium]|nr:glycosyltransferase [Candidatus Parcubacteria bacterium]